jgi:hypothetical protein
MMLCIARVDTVITCGFGQALSRFSLFCGNCLKKITNWASPRCCTGPQLLTIIILSKQSAIVPSRKKVSKVQSFRVVVKKWQKQTEWLHAEEPKLSPGPAHTPDKE